VSELAVILGDRVAGTLTRLRGGGQRFDYADDYRAQTPLSLSMPVQVRSHPNAVVTPWLWGLLPDNEAVLRRWVREFQASAASPFSLLGTPTTSRSAPRVRGCRPRPAGDRARPTASKHAHGSGRGACRALLASSPG
jgi:serine/threonine-protein kinase HipA